MIDVVSITGNATTFSLSRHCHTILITTISLQHVGLLNGKLRPQARGFDFFHSSTLANLNANPSDVLLILIL